MSQLPTYILFEKGVEVSRFPDFYVDAAPSLPITKVCFDPLAKKSNLQRLQGFNVIP